MQSEPFTAPAASVSEEAPTATLKEPETPDQHDPAVTKDEEEPMEQEQSDPVIQEESVNTVSQVKWSYLESYKTNRSMYVLNVYGPVAIKPLKQELVSAAYHLYTSIWSACLFYHCNRQLEFDKNWN